MGIKAMEQLKQLNGGRNSASRSMITLAALNTAGVTLVPTTVIAIRVRYQSAAPADILVPTLIVSLLSVAFALVIDRCCYDRARRGGGK